MIWIEIIKQDASSIRSVDESATFCCSLINAHLIEIFVIYSLKLIKSKATVIMHI